MVHLNSRSFGQAATLLSLEQNFKIQTSSRSIVNNIANVSPLPQHFFERSCVARKQNAVKMLVSEPKKFIKRFGVIQRI